MGPLNDGSASAGVVVDAIPPHSEEDACELAGQGNDGFALALSQGDPGCPLDHGIPPVSDHRLPGGLDEQTSEPRLAGLGDPSSALSVGARIFARDNAQVGLDSMGACEAVVAVQG